jgi:hypothetical protein
MLCTLQVHLPRCTERTQLIDNNSDTADSAC